MPDPLPRAPRYFLIATLLVLGACAQATTEVVAYTSVDQVFSEPIFQEFEHQSGIKVRVVYDTEETKSTGVLNRLIAESTAPQADVFWSGDPVRPFILASKGLIAPYISANASGVPPAFKAADGLWTGVAARARVLLVNTDLVAVDVRPTSVRDLINPRWKGKAAIANPLYGTTTMHAAAWFSELGDEAAQSFFSQLKANDIRLASSNGEVKRLVVTGEVAFGLLDTDDANEALREGAPVSVVYPDQEQNGTLLMPTSVVLMRGAPHAEAARKLVDYLLSPDVERQLAAKAAQIPLHPSVAVPPGTKRLADIRFMEVDYARLASDMERIEPWLRKWTGL